MCEEHSRKSKRKAQKNGAKKKSRNYRLVGWAFVGNIERMQRVELSWVLGIEKCNFQITEIKNVANVIVAGVRWQKSSIKPYLRILYIT